MDRTPGGGWSVGGRPVVPPQAWVDRLNAERAGHGGLPPVTRYSGLAMAVWSLAAPLPYPLTMISGV